MLTSLSLSLTHTRTQTGAISGKGDTILEMLLRLVSRQLNTLQDTLTYAQDYVNVYALRLWQEEFHRVIMFHVQQEVGDEDVLLVEGDQ